MAQKCKHCHSADIQMVKEWELKGKLIDKNTGKPFRFLITLWKCLDCNRAFRTSVRIPDAKETA